MNEIRGMDDALPKQSKESPAANRRPYVGVQFACCNVYLRIYRGADGKTYRGRCPRCGRSICFVEAPGGEDTRQFVVR